MPKRSRTIQWEDPKISSRNTQATSGLDYLSAIKNGDIAPPPAASLIGYRMVDVKVGQAVFELDPAEYHYNPFSTVHGGMLSTLLDTAMTAAVMTVLPAGKVCSTLELKVNFICPVSKKTGLITAMATLIHAGKRIATVESRLVDSKKKLYAHATSTCIILQT